ncbi:hypothetical protein VDGL01_06836 [Verticillium dahliae]
MAFSSIAEEKPTSMGLVMRIGHELIVLSGRERETASFLCTRPSAWSNLRSDRLSPRPSCIPWCSCHIVPIS